MNVFLDLYYNVYSHITYNIRYFLLQLIQQRQAKDLASQELHSQSIHIEELYDHGHQSVYLSEQFGSHEQLQHFKVLNDDIK